MGEKTNHREKERKMKQVEQYVMENAIVWALSNGPRKEEDIITIINQNQVVPVFTKKRFLESVKKVAYEVEIDNEMFWKLKRKYRKMA